MVSITTLCDRPMPSVKRLPVAAAAVRACWAMAVGWRGYVGVTAVPKPMRGTSRPTIAMVAIASKEKMFASHRLCRPAASTCLAAATTSSNPPSPPLAPSITPIRTFASPCQFPCHAL